MELIPPKRRFPPPWTVQRAERRKWYSAYPCPCRDDLHGICYAHSRLTSDEARRIENPQAFSDSTKHDLRDEEHF
jgi:hypothetical protein